MGDECEDRRHRGRVTYEAGYHAADQIAELDDQQDAVMPGSDDIAFGFMDGLRATGISVPETMSVTGFGGLLRNNLKAYDLTTTRQRCSGPAIRNSDAKSIADEGASKCHIPRAD